MSDHPVIKEVEARIALMMLGDVVVKTRVGALVYLRDYEPSLEISPEQPTRVGGTEA